MQLLCFSFVELVSYDLLLFLNNFDILLSVLCNYTVIRMRGIFPLNNTVAISLVGAGAVLYLVVIYIKFGEVNASSQKLIGSWKRSPKLVNGEERELVSKYFNSLPTLKIRLGTFGYFRKPASILIIGKLVFYTTKFLIIAKSQEGH